MSPLGFVGYGGHGGVIRISFSIQYRKKLLNKTVVLCIQGTVVLGSGRYSLIHGYGLIYKA